jgi:hypothetical protein
MPAEAGTAKAVRQAAPRTAPMVFVIENAMTGLLYWEENPVRSLKFRLKKVAKGRCRRQNRADEL